MVGNYENWDYLAGILNERLDEKGNDAWRALRKAGMKGTYLTFLLSGRARLKPQFVRLVAQTLDLDENWLFCVALEGMQQTYDLPYVSAFLWRMFSSLEEAKLQMMAKPQEEEQQKKKKNGNKGNKRKKKAN
ncbi:UNVERIFIED_ORG: cyanate lyase [Agrobacterium larrymoorei]|nr:cyanate lyase [Agrobacterium larrymoorei]